MPITPHEDFFQRNWSIEPSPETTTPFAGIAVPLQVRACGPLETVPGVETSASLKVGIDARFDERRGQYRLHEVSASAEAKGDDYEVTGARLRTIVPLTILRWILPRVIRIDPSSLSPNVMTFIAPEVMEDAERELDELEGREAALDAIGIALDLDEVAQLEEARERVLGPTARGPVDRPRSGPNPAELQDAVTVYRLALIVRERPAQAVAKALNLHQPTANNWLKIARREGLLD